MLTRAAAEVEAFAPTLPGPGGLLTDRSVLPGSAHRGLKVRGATANSPVISTDGHAIVLPTRGIGSLEGPRGGARGAGRGYAATAAGIDGTEGRELWAPHFIPAPEKWGVTTVSVLSRTDATDGQLPVCSGHSRPKRGES